MTVPPSSQVAPLPNNLPFRVVSRTIGQGAYASIRKAIPLHATKPVIAIKFVNKEHAFGTGRLSAKQLLTEISLHRHLGKHTNVIQFLAHGEDPGWTWIAMELAEGGDLFDKIEADQGVGEDVAHFYFSQLVNAVGYMHSKGVAHRDLKPENMLLSGEGDLKLADFGLAALFRNDQGQSRLCKGVCGSPPYMAPEVVGGKRPPGATQGGVPRKDVLERGYAPDAADIWSCGVVLFVLLAGNTPWDEPTPRSYEFAAYVSAKGRPGGAGYADEELWWRLPAGALSLLRGMLKLDPAARFGLDEVRTHPWFTRENPHLSPAGTAANPVGLATQMLESLRIDFSADPTTMPLSQQEQRRRVAAAADAMDIDDGAARFASTQPETPLQDMAFDWERPARADALHGISASQPASGAGTGAGPRGGASTSRAPLLLDGLANDPSLSQFMATPSVPESLTQAARRFRDIVPAHSLARFLSGAAPALLLATLAAALHRLGVPVPPETAAAARAEALRAQGEAWIRVKTVDGRQQGLNGNVVVETVGDGVWEVRFLKAKGDPLEWRRFFKKVAVLCKDVVLLPG
ncbi:serine/threonine-protein kinase-like protein chk1 [Lineolata rhizophorae]|uniref:non-specific serine/threonine protein kinase n=1 Tax=Lineolata rhizophorae TaxID=578093 RepID=A0A6A6PCK6_9PEZI|nr:serine/threonine-protein kinase-like protein chk1 [Lineolata rhizophorae]